MPYCIYLRKSRADLEAEARGEGETLARHERALLSLASSRALDITAIYREIVSGETISARPEMRRLLNEVEKGAWEGVLVTEVERLARGDTIDQGVVSRAFSLSNTKIITPLKDYDPSNEFDEEYFEFGLFMSRREYKTINRRMQRGRIASVTEGNCCCPIAPYGYERVRNTSGKGFTLAIVPQEAEIVKLVFEMYTTGDTLPDGGVRHTGMARICRRLNAMGRRTRRGGVWTTSTLRDMLTNPVYTGMIRWNWRRTIKGVENGEVVKSRPRSMPDSVLLVKGNHPPIVNKELFEKAQETIRKNPPRTKWDHDLKNPLSGVIKCGLCGRNMVRRPYTDKSKPVTLMCREPTCPNVSASIDTVEKRLLEAIADWIAEYKISIKSTEAIVSGSALSQLTATQTELSAVITQTDKTHDLLERGIYDTDTFLERMRKLSEKKAELSAHIASLEQQCAAEKAAFESRSRIIPRAEQLLATYHTLSSAQAKNDYLKEVLEKVEYFKDTPTHKKHNPDDFTLKLFPRVPKQ